jgi:hypothetical protein
VLRREARREMKLAYSTCERRDDHQLPEADVLSLASIIYRYSRRPAFSNVLRLAEEPNTT